MENNYFNYKKSNWNRAIEVYVFQKEINLYDFFFKYQITKSVNINAIIIQL